MISLMKSVCYVFTQPQSFTAKIFMASSLPSHPSLDFRILFESVPGLYLVLAPDLTIVAVTQAYLQATMRTRESIVGRPLFEVFPDNPADKFATGERNLRASLARVFREHVADTMAVQKYDIQRPESEGGGFEERFWSPVNFPVLNASNQLVFILHSVQDVTEFVRLKQRSSEEKSLRQLLTHNENMETEIFLRAQELQKINEQLRNANNDLKLVHAELEQKLQDGTSTLIQTNVALQAEILERRRTDHRLQSIVNTAVDGIVTIDRRGTVLTFNKAAEKIFDYTAAEVAGCNVKLLMPEPYHGEHDGYLSAYLATGVRKIIGIGREVQGRRRDGTIFPLELAVSEFEVDGEVCFTGLVRDITERKKLENQLQQAQKMEAIGQLAGGVAHDFNNLLTVIMGYSDQLLALMGSNAECDEMVGEIRHAGERAAALTGQLLAFSRKQVLAPQVFDLNAAVVHIEKMLQRLIGEDIQLITQLAPDAISIKADPGQIDQILMNLAVNARDAMPQGGRLTIETRNVEIDDKFGYSHAESQRGQFVQLAVTDTGSGMTPEVRSRIFEPFFTTKGVGKGTGLGLSVVHGIVKQSGGRLDVYSEVNLGTSFKIYFPGVGIVAKNPASRDPSEPFKGTETILLVEDEDMVRDLIFRILEKQGYTVLKAKSGKESLQLIEGYAGQISLLVTDVVMPEMSGPEVARQLQARNPKLRVLYLSGYTDDAVVRHGILQSDVAFLQKPFTPKLLARKVREVLDEQ